MRPRKRCWWPGSTPSLTSRWPNYKPSCWPNVGRRSVWAWSGGCWLSTTYGEKKAWHASERDTPRIVAQRARFVEAVAQHEDPRRFKFVDETGIHLALTRRYGRAVGGARVGQGVPLRVGTPVTVVAALTTAGLEAIMSLDGALNQTSFAVYLTQVLGPTLQPGDVVVLDNLSVHHVAGMAELVEARGARLLFLPPYSPDFAPIELAWSKLKAALRTAQARTREALEAALTAAVAWITSEDAKNWFDHCGYHVHSL